MSFYVVSGMNVTDYAWGKLKVATVAVTPLADGLRYIAQSGCNAHGFSVPLFSWAMESGVTEESGLSTPDGWGQRSIQGTFHRWDQRFQTRLEAGKFSLSRVQLGLDPGLLATFE